MFACVRSVARERQSACQSAAALWLALRFATRYRISFEGTIRFPNLRIMLDPRDWKAILEVYAREPNLALALSYQFIALKQSLQEGPKGIAEAIAGINQAIEELYLHTDFNKMGRRLFYLTIEQTITSEQEDLLIALKKSLRQKRKPIMTPDNTTKHKPHISLVKAASKAKPTKTRTGTTS